MSLTAQWSGFCGLNLSIPLRCLCPYLQWIHSAIHKVFIVHIQRPSWNRHVCYVHRCTTSFMDVCLGYEWKNKEWHILWVFGMCMLVCLCPKGTRKKEKSRKMGWKIAKLYRMMGPLLASWWGKSLKACSTLEGQPVFCICVVFCVLYFMHLTRKSAQCNRNPNTAISDFPTTNSSCRKLPEMDQKGTNKILLLFLFS